MKLKNWILSLVSIIMIIMSLGLTVSAQTFVKENDSYYILGDCNKSQNTDIRDLVRMKKIIVSEEKSIVADLNGDGAVNSSDLVMLRMYLLEVDDSVNTGGKYWSENYGG